MSLLLIISTSFIAGVVNAIAGGGTFLTFPVLTRFAGLTQKDANLTSTIGLWPGSASSIFAAARDFARIPAGMIFAFSVMSLVGGVVGSILLLTTSMRSFELAIPWLLAFATLVFGFSRAIARWAGRRHGKRSLGWTLLVAVVQLFIAAYGGYFGAGMGVLMLAGFSFAGLDDIHQMNAMKVLMSTLVNAVASIIFIIFSSFDSAARSVGRMGIHLSVARIDWHIAGWMAIASVVGGFWGMAAGRRIRPDILRGGILLIGAGLTCYYFAVNYFHVR